MRALVCGGRDCRDREQAFSYLDQLHAKYKFTEIIAGAAAGADTFACMWAESRGVPWREFPANWDRYGDKAGRIRNTRMLEENPGTTLASRKAWSDRRRFVLVNDNQLRVTNPPGESIVWQATSQDLLADDWFLL